MNAGEPPDETGESEVDDESSDPETADVSRADGDADSQEDDAASGGDGDLDPAQEVEAAVEEVMGPGALDDEGDEDDLGEADSDDAVAGDETEDGDLTDDEGADATDAAGEDGEIDAVESEDGDGSTTDDRAGSRDDDVLPVMEPAESYRRDEPKRIDDAADGDEIDESAAVQAAQELADAGRSGATADAETGQESAEAADATAAEEAQGAAEGEGADDVSEPAEDVPEDVRKYDRFKKIDGGTYDRANEFLRDRTYITAREWAMARLCADFRTETGVEMTKIGENLPELVPFMTDTYTPQAVNQARAAFEEKVRKAGATFLYGAMCDFFTAEELDDVMYEATEVAKFLLEVEGVELSVEEELAAEDHISEVMRDVREHSAALRHDEVTCPECGHQMNADD